MRPAEPHDDWDGFDDDRYDDRSDKHDEHDAALSLRRAADTRPELLCRMRSILQWSHCVPTAIVPSGLQSLMAACTDGLCAPDPIIAAAGQFVPNTCASIAGVEGRCLSTCLPAVAARAATLPQSGCAVNERCMPCFDPTASDPNAPTGACSLACDAPAQPPVLLTCPWTGPDVYNPSVFAA